MEKCRQIKYNEIWKMHTTIGSYIETGKIIELILSDKNLSKMTHI